MKELHFKLDWPERQISTELKETLTRIFTSGAGLTSKTSKDCFHSKISCGEAEKEGFLASFL